MRRGCLSLLVVLSGGLVHADEPPEAPYDLEAELAWARATWPEDLKGLRFQVPLAKLLSWAPRKGTAIAYLYTNDFACQRLELTRVEPKEPDPDNPPELIGRFNGPERLEDGRPFREVTFIEIGQTLSRERGVIAFERRDEEGNWELGGGGVGLVPIVYGDLSYVDDRVARFDGEALFIRPYCDGPTQWLSCPGGGEHPCDRCDRVALLVMPVGINGWGYSDNHGGRAISCHDRCPPHPVSADLARIDALNAHARIWRPQKTPLATVPSLYKSRDDCRREHPPRSRRAADGGD